MSYYAPNRPRSIYQYFNLAPRLSSKNCKFFEFLLSLHSQKRLGYKENNIKYRSLSWKPRSHVRIFIYRTWPVMPDCCWINTTTVYQVVLQYRYHIHAHQHGGRKMAETFVIVGLNPGPREKSRITWMCMLETPPFSPKSGGRPYMAELLKARAPSGHLIIRSRNTRTTSKKVWASLWLLKTNHQKLTVSRYPQSA